MNHIIMPNNGYLTEDLISLAMEYGDDAYIANELAQKIRFMGLGMFYIFNDNKYWQFHMNDGIWWCKAADQRITNPNHERYKE